MESSENMRNGGGWMDSECFFTSCVPSARSIRAIVLIFFSSLHEPFVQNSQNICPDLPEMSCTRRFRVQRRQTVHERVRFPLSGPSIGDRQPSDKISQELAKQPPNSALNYLVPEEPGSLHCRYWPSVQREKTLPRLFLRILNVDSYLLDQIIHYFSDFLANSRVVLSILDRIAQLFLFVFQ
jgi:hypothetical protein